MGNPFDALHQIKCFQCRARAFVESASYTRVRAHPTTQMLLTSTYDSVQQSIDKDPAFSSMSGLLGIRGRFALSTQTQYFR